MKLYVLLPNEEDKPELQLALESHDPDLLKGVAQEIAKLQVADPPSAWQIDVPRWSKAKIRFKRFHLGKD